MLSSDKFWVSKNLSFSDIVDYNNVIKIKWNKNVGTDYIHMAKAYFRSAELITVEILNEEHDNSKYDQWFFSAMYLFRQAIELICKGIVAAKCDSKEQSHYFCNTNIMFLICSSAF